MSEWTVYDWGERTAVTEDNIDEIREDISALDQRAAIRLGTEITHHVITYEPGGQRGDVTIYHDTNRVAIALGGDSEWGDYCPGGDTYDSYNMDSGARYYEDGSLCEEESVSAEAAER